MHEYKKKKKEGKEDTRDDTCSAFLLFSFQAWWLLCENLESLYWDTALFIGPGYTLLRAAGVQISASVTTSASIGLAIVVYVGLLCLKLRRQKSIASGLLHYLFSS